MFRHWLIISFLTFLVIFQTFEHHKVASGPDLGCRLWLAGLGLAGLRLAVLRLRARLTSLATNRSNRWSKRRPPKRCRKDMKRSLSNFPEIGHLKLTMTRIFLGYAYVESRVVLCFRSFASLTCASFLHCPQSFPCSFFMCPCFVMFFCDIHDQLKERWSCV